MSNIVMKHENEGLEHPTCAKIRGPKGAESLKITFITRVIQPAISTKVTEFIGQQNYFEMNKEFSSLWS
jgi:hypothetical protein